MLWDNALVHCKDLSLIFFNKTLIGQEPGRKHWRGNQTKTRKGRESVTGKMQRKQDENDLLRKQCLTEERWLNIDKDYGLI